MAEIAFWEQQMVEKFVVKAKRERYLLFLTGPKRRHQILDRLNYAFDYDPGCATKLMAGQRTKDGLLELLRSRYVDEICRLMADGNNYDGWDLRLEVGVSLLLDNQWGALLICPPKPIAVYKSEDIGDVLLLEECIA